MEQRNKAINALIKALVLGTYDQWALAEYKLACSMAL